MSLCRDCRVRFSVETRLLHVGLDDSVALNPSLDVNLKRSDVGLDSDPISSLDLDDKKCLLTLGGDVKLGPEPAITVKKRSLALGLNADIELSALIEARSRR
ncbi:unnamed protein product [Peniophora sp. CBMAI 1063]|nr:unnamed protein product [Peniophora sp. CBMAI 1063]